MPFPEALKALAEAINECTTQTVAKASYAKVEFSGGYAEYKRKAGDPMAVALIYMKGELRPLLRAMKAMTGDNGVEWAIAHVSHKKTISADDLAAGIEALAVKAKAVTAC